MESKSTAPPQEAGWTPHGPPTGPPEGMYPHLNPPPYQPNVPTSYPAQAPSPAPAPIPAQIPMIAPMTVAVGPQPAVMTCPSCRAQVRTRLQHESSTKTHLIALLLCIIGCWPCCFIPYCVDSCQNAEHYCPNCNAFIGTYSN